MSLVLGAWFYFATVDSVQVWGVGPFSSREECLVHREMTVPITVEATSCGLMVVQPEED